MKIVLEIPDHVNHDTDIKLLLKDALGEFIDTRTNGFIGERAETLASIYVGKRYDFDSSDYGVKKRQEKIKEVMHRVGVASILKLAVDNCSFSNGTKAYKHTLPIALNVGDLRRSIENLADDVEVAVGLADGELIYSLLRAEVAEDKAGQWLFLEVEP